MISPEAPPILPRCPHCGAHVQPQAAQCWLCYGELAGVEPIVASLAEPPAFSQVAERVFQIVFILLATLVGLVVLGAFHESPAAGMMLVMVLFLPCTLAAVRLQLQKQRKGSVSWGERLATYVLSLSLMFLALVLLMVAAFVALIIYCLVAQPSLNFH
ncbi:MAG: hypothetical protein U0939_13595 [Pirellulales bacterium]